MKKIAKYSVVGLASALLLGGIALADTGTVGNTGPNSSNGVTSNNSQNTNQENNNHTSVDNNSDQTCQSGSANTSGNTNAGSATSGGANCENTTSTIINIANGGDVTPGKGAGSAEAAQAAAVPAAAVTVTSASTLPQTGIGSNWILSAAIGSLAVVALKLSLEAMQKNASLSY